MRGWVAHANVLVPLPRGFAHTVCGLQFQTSKEREKQLFVELAAADSPSHGLGCSLAATRLYNKDSRWEAAVQATLTTTVMATLTAAALVLLVVCLTGYACSRLRYRSASLLLTPCLEPFFGAPDGLRSWCIAEICQLVMR